MCMVPWWFELTQEVNHRLSFFPHTYYLFPTHLGCMTGYSGSVVCWFCKMSWWPLCLLWPLLYVDMLLLLASALGYGNPLVLVISPLTSETCLSRCVLLCLFSFCPTTCRHVGLPPFLYPPPSIRPTVLITIRSHIYDLTLSPHALYNIHLLLQYDLSCSPVRYTSQSHWYDHW